MVARPASGSEFEGWSGACAGSGACQVTMSGDQAITATFNGSGAEPPGKIGDRAGRRKFAVTDTQLRRLIPLPAFERKACGYSG